LSNYIRDTDIGSGYSEETDSVMVEGFPYRATGPIDETGKNFHESVNDTCHSRNVNEYLRMVDVTLISRKRRS
jgi:peroxiredoxin (alkyl hydroperoxide reductase subunit C)